MITYSTLWMFGLGPKPEEGLTVAPIPVFEKVYLVHCHGHEVDPTQHKCRHCGTVTTLFCDSCDQPTCESCYGMEKFGGPYGDGPSGLNYCKSCMDGFNNRGYEDEY